MKIGYWWTLSALVGFLGHVACSPVASDVGDDEGSGGSSLPASGGASSGGTSTGGESNLGGASTGGVGARSWEALTSASEEPLERLALLDGYFYYTAASLEDEFSSVETTSLLRMPAQGGTPEVVTSQLGERIWPVAADALHVYFIREDAGGAVFLHRASLGGTFPVVHEPLADGELDAYGSFVLAETDELLLFFTKRFDPAFKYWVFDKVAGGLLHTHSVSDLGELPTFQTARLEGESAIIRTSLSELYSIAFATGEATLVGAYPDGCGIAASGTSWLGVCSSEGSETASVVRMQDSGEYEVLGADVLSTSGSLDVVGGTVIQLSGKQAVVFDEASRSSYSFSVSEDTSLFRYGADEQYLYAVDGEITQLFRLDYSK